jgi:hypothetical protein
MNMEVVGSYGFTISCSVLLTFRQFVSLCSFHAYGKTFDYVWLCFQFVNIFVSLFSLGTFSFLRDQPDF